MVAFLNCAPQPKGKKKSLIQSAPFPPGDYETRSQDRSRCLEVPVSPSPIYCFQGPLGAGDSNLRVASSLSIVRLASVRFMTPVSRDRVLVQRSQRKRESLRIGTGKKRGEEEEPVTYVTHYVIAPRVCALCALSLAI